MPNPGLKKAKEDLPHGDSGGLHNPDPSTDFAKLGKSNRPLHRQLGAGKGDDPRPVQDPAAFTRNWCATFGHKFVAHLAVCVNGCGTKRSKKRNH